MSDEINGSTFRHIRAWPSYVGVCHVERNLAGVRWGPVTITAGAIFRVPRRHAVERWALVVVGAATMYEAKLSDESPVS